MTIPTARPDSIRRKVIIVGAGPAGLTAAYKLGQLGIDACVIEKEQGVGGISKTVLHKGYRFDVGGHRFFTKVSAVEKMWMEVLGEEDFLLRKRQSRIYYEGHLFDYPLRLRQVLGVLGMREGVKLGLSYVWSRLKPIRPERSFEDWVTNRFGARLYRTFFKTYTEKVWGMSCREISADWAAQRIKGLSMLAVIRNAIVPQGGRFGNRPLIRTLADSFRYPRFGPGQMWETTAGKVREMGGQVLLETKTRQIHWKDGRVLAMDIDENGKKKRLTGTHFISTMPIRNLIRQLEPAPPARIREAAEKLRYRDFLTVSLILKRKHVFEDNWIYIHDPDVKVGRIQNFKNWSPDMVPNQEMTCLGLEYFCFEGDNLWTTSDEELIELAKREIEKLGLAKVEEIEDGAVLRMPKAYPVYDDEYREVLEEICGFLAGFENLYLTGRNGMHKYNNQDHSMFSAMLAVENICGARHNLWSVNADEDYHEEVRETAGGHLHGTDEGRLNGFAAGEPSVDSAFAKKEALRRDIAMLSSTQPPVPTATAELRKVSRCEVSKWRR